MTRTTKITPAQQRALDDLRAERELRAKRAAATRAANKQLKAQAKPTVIDAHTEEVLHAAHEELHAGQHSDESLVERLQDAYQAWAERIGASSPRRYIAGMVLSLTASIGTGYLASQVVGMLVSATVMATSSAFLATMVLVLGLVLAMYASWRVGGAVFEYVVTKRVDAHINKCKSIVTGFFARGTQLEAAA